MVCDIYRAQNRLVFCALVVGGFVIFERVPRPHNFGGILRGWCDFVFDEIVFCCINFINKNFYIFLEFF